MKAKAYSPDYARAAFSEWFVGTEGANGEQRAYCPICEDPETSKSPSASFNFVEGVWNCPKSDHGGRIRDLAEQLKREKDWNIREAYMRGKNNNPDFAARRDEGLIKAGRRAAPLPSAQQVEAWNSRLIKSDKPRNELISKRGFDIETIEDFQVGWDGERYTFPIYDAGGELVNVRRYKMNVAHNKVVGISGHNDAVIYGLDDLQEFNKIVITEGETDCLLLRQYFRAAGIEDYGVITSTSGARAFLPQWASLFKDKTVWVCYDVDEPGKRGAIKVAQILDLHVENVYVVHLPIITLPGADITDYLRVEGHTVEEFIDLMKDAARASEIQNNRPVATSGARMSINDSLRQSAQNLTIEMEVSVTGKQHEPYEAPKKFTATCGMNKGAVCISCPIMYANGKKSFEMRVDDEELFRFTESSESRKKTLMKEFSGAMCSDRVEFAMEEKFYIEKLLAQPSIDTRRDQETQEPIERAIFTIGEDRAVINEKIRIVGRNVPDPKTNQVRFLAWFGEKVDMDIDNFSLTPEIREDLLIFQPNKGQRPLEKCREIANDLATNVTCIYGRDILHIAYDLVYHSVLAFKFQGKDVDKGWLEMMVLGDTRTGKSEIAMRLIEHYKAGRLLSCEGVSFAGIVGGNFQPDGGKWMMKWGAVPLNDRRLVFLDEVTGLADSNVIERMSSIRSSGIAQITKIAGDLQTSARTRLIWIANPPGGTSNLRSIQDQGLDVLKAVVAQPEDIARFDFVCAAREGEVASSLINNNDNDISNSIGPIYTSELCETLVKWAWSLGRDDVFITPIAARLAIQRSEELGRQYVPDPPLIQIANVRYKIMRIACAIAARTFSVRKDGKLWVKSEHVEDAIAFINEIYSSDAMSYRLKSRRAIKAAEQANANKGVIKGWLIQNPQILLTLQAVGNSRFRQRDFEESGHMDKQQASQVVSHLVRKHMILRRDKGELTKEPALIEVLKWIDEEEEQV